MVYEENLQTRAQDKKNFGKVNLPGFLNACS